MAKKSKSSSAPVPTWRDVLAIHPAAARFPMMTPAELADLSIDIKQYGQLEPIAIIEKAVPRADGSVHVEDPRQIEVLDGRNRLDAMETAGIKVVDKKGQLLDSVLHVVIDPQETDPYRYVISRNIHRRHLTNEKKREVIAELIKLDPARSDRQIAGELKVSPTTVGTERARLEQAGEVSKLDTRTDAKGVKQPAGKRPKPSKTPKATSPTPEIAERAEARAAQMQATQVAADQQTDSVIGKADFSERAATESSGANVLPPATPVIPTKPRGGGYDSSRANAQQLVVSLEKAATQLAYVAGKSSVEAVLALISDDARLRTQFARVQSDWLIQFANMLAEMLNEPAPMIH